MTARRKIAPPCVPLTLSERKDARDAAADLGVSDETIYRWAKRFGIGRKFEADSYALAAWWISWPAARMVKDRDFEALEAFRSGDRTSELVRPYLYKLPQ